MKITIRQIRKAVIMVAVLLVVGGVGYRLGEKQSSVQAGKLVINRQSKLENPEVNLDLFWVVWERLEESFLDKDRIDPAQMVYGAISGMVAALGDPYTVFLPPKDNLRSTEDLAGAFGGVGIQLGYIDQQLAVIAPLTDTPAEKAGIMAGDLILAIDGQETMGVSLPKAVDLIRGEEGTIVVLTILHEGSQEPVEIEVRRGTIVVDSVELEFMNDWCPQSPNCLPVAYLRLIRFGDRTNQEWGEAIDQIKQQCPGDSGHCRGMVLDLRNNPGGYLTGSVFIASEFLSSGIVVQQETVSGSRQSFSVDRTGKLLNLPLVVLVNKGSASASEIVAGALKEHGRAKIVGEVTFGKGSIQEAEDLAQGAGLHITTARWLLPSGQSIDEIGLTPDVEVTNNLDQPEEDLQLQEAIEVLNK